MRSRILRRGISAVALVLLALMSGSRQARVLGQSADDIVLLASSAHLVGAWRVMSTSGAAGGTATVLPNANRAKVVTPVANPGDYFELTFNVTANVPYHLWVRGKADGNSKDNDSVHIQFTNSIDASGAASWRIGSTTSAEVNLEDCSGCGNAGWGWEDNGWGSVGAAGPHIRFATSGAQTLRVQNREDGFFIDQVVLSPSTYLTTSPGTNKNDTTILIGTPPPPSATIVREAYLQQMTDHSVIVVWATREPGPASVVTNGRTYAAVSTRFAASRTGFTYDYYQHEAEITGLDASTSYAYELRLGSALAGGDTFQTAPAIGTGNVRFVAFADSGIGSTVQKSLAARMLSDTWDLAIHAGDIVYGTTSTSGDATYKTYQSWFFDVYKGWLTKKPFFPTMGNHDGRASNNYGQAYRDIFVLPESAATGPFPADVERYYSFDYGPIHFVALDTERAFQDTSRRAAQLSWLADDLESTSQPWKIVYMHRSPYSSGGEHGSDVAVRQAFGPVLEAHGVQLAITAHEHVYERSVPWRESTDRSHQAVTYIITGGGGARLYPAGSAGWTAFSKSDYQYLRVSVAGCVLTADSIKSNGSSLDTYSLDRCAQANDLANPTVRVTAPSNGATVSGVVSITASATDDVRVEKVDFWIDGVLKAIDRTASYSYSWDSRTVAAGTHRIEARAYDIDGNRVSSTVVSVTSTGS